MPIRSEEAAATTVDETRATGDPLTLQGATAAMRTFPRDHAVHGFTNNDVQQEHARVSGGYGENSFAPDDRRRVQQAEDNECPDAYVRGLTCASGWTANRTNSAPSWCLSQNPCVTARRCVLLLASVRQVAVAGSRTAHATEGGVFMCRLLLPRSPSTVNKNLILKNDTSEVNFVCPNGNDPTAQCKFMLAFTATELQLSNGIINVMAYTARHPLATKSVELSTLVIVDDQFQVLATPIVSVHGSTTMYMELLCPA